MPGWTQTLHHIDTDGDTVVLWFEETLFGDQGIILQRCIDLHLAHRKLHCIEEYHGNRLITHTWYARLDGDGEPTQKVEETTCIYSGNG